MKRSKNPPHVHEYENQHGNIVYYLRRPGYKKVRLRIPDDALPWSPRFMAIYDAAIAEMPAVPTRPLMFSIAVLTFSLSVPAALIAPARMSRAS